MTSQEMNRLPSRRARLQARGRRGVLIGLAYFVVAQVGLAIYIESWRPELRNPTFEIKYHQFVNLQRQHAQRPASVVFLGSSMTVQAVDAKTLESKLGAVLDRPVVAYNFGINGNGPLAHLIHMQRLLRRGERPDIVVIELAPLLYDADQEKIEIARFPAETLERDDLVVVERLITHSDLRTDWWQSHLVPVHGHRLSILNLSARVLVPFADRVELWEESDPNGWWPKPAATAAEHPGILAGVRSEFQARVASHKIGNMSIAALDELADLLAAEQLATVFVQMPEGPMMRTLLTEDVVNSVTRRIEPIRRKHNIPQIEARTWFGEEMFRDSYHLHREGAQAFTERLADEITNPMRNALKNSTPARHAGRR